MTNEVEIIEFKQGVLTVIKTEERHSTESANKFADEFNKKHNKPQYDWYMYARISK